jgi:predicted permease
MVQGESLEKIDQAIEILGKVIVTPALLVLIVKLASYFIELPFDLSWRIVIIGLIGSYVISLVITGLLDMYVELKIGVPKRRKR